jgi:putative copper export protein
MMAAIWFGSLWALYPLVRSHSGTTAATLLKAFSARASAMIAMLLGSAAILVWLQLQDISDFLQTGYGLLLTIKITLAWISMDVSRPNIFHLNPVYPII